MEKWGTTTHLHQSINPCVVSAPQRYEYYYEHEHVIAICLNIHLLKNMDSWKQKNRCFKNVGLWCFEHWILGLTTIKNVNTFTKSVWCNCSWFSKLVFLWFVCKLYCKYFTPKSQKYNVLDFFQVLDFNYFLKHLFRYCLKGFLLSSGWNS